MAASVAPSPARRALLAALVSAAALACGVAWPVRAARACAACGCGDPTLTSLGNEQPSAGRLRAAVEMRFRSDTVGVERLDRIALREVRLDHSLSYAPLERLFLQVIVPLVWRQVEYVNLARDTVTGLGDVELRARGIVFRDRRFAPRHLVSLLGGIKLPTAPVLRGPDGAPLSLEAQPGTGSFDPIVGAAYGLFHDPVSLYASVTGYVTTAGREGLRSGRSLRTTVAGQWQPRPWVALRLGIDTRHDGRTRIGGDADPHSGGSIAFVSPDLVVRPVGDLIVQAGVRVPFVQALHGAHREGTFVVAALVYDLR